jgi:hypothetical protein
MTGPEPITAKRTSVTLVDSLAVRNQKHGELRVIVNMVYLTDVDDKLAMSLILEVTRARLLTEGL